MKKNFRLFLPIVFIINSNMYSQGYGGQCNHYYQYISGPIDICEERTIPWVLVFEDDFNSAILDTSVWNIEEGIPRDASFEKQKAWHTKNNIEMENGLLKIITKEESFYNVCDDVFGEYVCSDFNYSSGELKTKMKFGFGKFEALIKIPNEKGLWPAFWLFGQNNNYNEIDIFEFMHNDFNTLKTNLWYPYNINTYCSWDYSNGPDYPTSFVKYTLEWDEYEIRWYINDNSTPFRSYPKYFLLSGQEVCELHDQGIQENQHFPIESMSLILNVAVETGDHAPDQSSMFPSEMQVDWIRYYLRSNSPDIVLSSPPQIYADKYNVIVGDNVIINCDLSMNSQEQLIIVAKSSITLDPGTAINSNTSFKAIVDPNNFY